MPDPTIARPETIKIVQTIHDTAHVVVRDTIVRVAEPASNGAPAASKSDLPGIITVAVRGCAPRNFPLAPATRRAPPARSL